MQHGGQIARDVPPGFWERVSQSVERLLLLDYDGTLAPFTADRDRAVPYPAVSAALQTLAAAGHTRLVVISGRSAGEVQALLGLDPAPEIWGSHGQERRIAGQLVQGDLSEEQTDALAAAIQAASQCLPAEAVETKHGCVAAHWRGLSPQEQQRVREQVEAAWKPLAGGSLALHIFDGGLELRRADVHKGTVINELIRELGNQTVIAYLGDDLTDEDAFAALKGRGLTVLVRSEHRPTLAEVWLRPPEDVVRFLVAWHEAASRSRRT